MSDTATKFKRVAELARQARAIHLALYPQTWGTAVPTIDADLAALRRLVESGLGQAVHARNAGNRALGDQLEVQAAATLDAALPLWRARLAAAEAERDRVAARTPKEHPLARLAAMQGVYPSLPAQPLFDACHELTRRVDRLLDAANHGRFDDDTLISTTLAGLDQVAKDLRSSVVRGRLAARLRIAAASAATITDVALQEVA